MCHHEAFCMKMDKECVRLCAAMNKVPGIKTVESGCGHGQAPYHIWFQAKRLASLPRLLYWFQGRYCGFYGWRCLVTMDFGCSPVTFMIEGPKGEEGYQQSLKIARLLMKDNA